jgi:hypothetical protein
MPIPYFMRDIVRHRIFKFIPIALAASFGLARPVAAQRAEEPSVGSRIRIGLPDTLRVSPFVRGGQWIAGTLVRATPDSLVLHVGGANPFFVARRDVTTLAVSEGSSRVRSAADHAFFGAVLFGIATYLVDDAEGGVQGRRVAIAAGSGAAVGAVLGALSPFEHWRKVRR